MRLIPSDRMRESAVVIKEVRVDGVVRSVPESEDCVKVIHRKAIARDANVRGSARLRSLDGEAHAVEGIATDEPGRIGDG